MDLTDIPAAAPARNDARRVAEAEYRALLTQLRTLDQEQWAMATECEPWSVRDMVAHLAGAAEEAVRLRVQLRHLREARRRIGEADFVDVLNEQQLADREGQGGDELLAELTALAQRAPKARMKTPWFIRRRPLPSEAGGLPGDTMAYLLDVIYTRDIWMHRIDIARATGSPLAVSGVENDVVSQVVRDLDRGWGGAPFALTLTGPGGGRWLIGNAPDEETAPSVELDTAAAARLWSGRSDETGLTPDSAVATALVETRLLF